MTNTDQYAVFGSPISQSKSPLIHTWFAKQSEQLLSYKAIEPEVDGFKKEAKRFFAQGAQGCNITAPFKLEAFELADELTERAQWAGSVNTLKKLDDGRLLGDNTDGEGLVQDLLRQNVSLTNAKVLIIGAGGATQGVVKPLLDALGSGGELVITNRTFSKAEQLVERFEALNADNSQLNAQVKAQVMGEIKSPFDLVINATSAGFSGQLPEISLSIFSSNSWCYDMSYHQEITPFNHWAMENGVKNISDGLGMLVGQAAESFQLWREVRPDVEQVLQELRALLK